MKKRIAIVDDHIMFRKSLATLINCFSDCEVVMEAGNGVQMMEHLALLALLPDIVLMDITMPLMNGYEATGWLGENYPSVKVLALSTMSNDQAIIKMIQKGARGYILKDADPSELRLAINEVLQVGYFYNTNISRELVKTIVAFGKGAHQAQAIQKLTPREFTFLQLSCSDKSYQQIADEMSISMRTVDGYRDSLFKRFNVASRVGMVLYALRNEIIEL